jgi:hypothetical protein
MTKLKTLSINNTDLDSGLEYLAESVEKFKCSADQRKEAKCQAIFNLFANDQGEVETENYGEIKDFPQKLQDYKQKLQEQPQQTTQILQPTIPNK